MKANAWCKIPHTPIRHPERYYEPYICRLAPSDRSFTLQWLDNGGDGAHTLYCRLRGSEDEWVAVPLTEKTVTVSGIENLVDYELYIERDDKSGKSRTRLVNACDAPGVVINYIHPEDNYYDFAGSYIGSPNILELPSGNFLATHDIFGKSEFGFAMVFISRDKGETWEYQCEMHRLRECKPFLHNGRLLMIASYTRDIAITESLDEGKTWREPVVLLRTDRYFEGKQKSSGQLTESDVIVHNGRICFSLDVGAWGLTCQEGYSNSIMSAPADCDLFDKDNWDYTPLTSLPLEKIKIPGVQYDYVVAVEGNVISGPDGELYDMIRMDHILRKHIAKGDFTVPNNMAALYRFKSVDEPLEFVQTVDVAVGLRSMFFVQYDKVSGYYFVLGNECKAGNETDEPNGTRRCVYTLSASKDLINWRKLKELINCSDKANYCVSQPAFIIDGDDLCYLSRTGWGKISNQHDNNLITFHREKNFRNLL